MKTSIKIILLLTFFAVNAHGQQTAQFSNFITNALYYNPSIVGGQDCLVFKTGQRSQWNNFDGAPSTTFASLSTRLFQPKNINSGKALGLGGYFQNDLIGPFKRSSLNIAFAYNLLLQREMAFSFGLNAGLQQFGFDATKVRLTQANDPLINGSGKLFLLPNLGLGGYLECRNWYVGLSAKQMFNSNWSKLIGSSNSVDQIHYHLMFGQRFKKEKISFSPNIIINKTKNTLPSFDANLMLEFSNKISTGFSWRNTSAFVCLLNLKILDQINLHYSYDFTTSKLRIAGVNTHEIMIGIKANSKKFNDKTDLKSILFY